MIIKNCFIDFHFIFLNLPLSTGEGEKGVSTPWMRSGGVGERGPCLHSSQLKSGGLGRVGGGDEGPHQNVGGIRWLRT